ncbi:MAG TPA: phenylalanine--tRNA ligase subunit beta [Burkholderiales bacterium]
MIIPESWLRTLCNPRVAGRLLADKLTMAGVEVETYDVALPAIAGVVAAEVLSVERHPNADKLTVCTVRAGERQYRVVCGAPNVRKGMIVPLATIGAKLPGLEVKRASIRGVESEGMLCSALELGLSDDHSGLLELDDHVFTFKLTPNRADCLSILGVAREVSALTGTKLKSPSIRSVSALNKAIHPFKISSADGCGRFAGRVIRGVNASAKTPAWMRERLERAGQRSISALVDVTNYVMLELGRPLHVYDLDKLRGPIDVRWGRKGEKVLLLNGQNVEVDPQVLCITDDSGVIGLAGIMGGESTKADERTQQVFLESAFFHPDAIAGRARRYGFSSDAAHRFERGVDFANNVDGIERATRLILDICGGEAGPTADKRARLPKRKPVTMRTARAGKIIGIAVSEKEIAAVFSKLNFDVRKKAGSFVVNPPSYRFDIAIEEDLIEEVARIHGFERIRAHPPRVAATLLREPETRRPLHALRERLAAADYHEVINFSFADPAWEADFAGASNPIRLLNPIASQQSVMRTTLIGSLIDVVKKNNSRRLPRIRVFEVGRVFLRDPGAAAGPLAVKGVRQPMRVGAAAFGAALDEQWGLPLRAVDFYDVKADVEALCAPLVPRFEAAAHPAFHPGRSARVLLDGRPAGWLGELHPQWQRKAELPQPTVVFELDAEPLESVPLPAPTPPSRFPQVVRDMALLVDSKVPAEALLAAMRAEKPPIVREVRLFDLYQGPSLPQGRKSLAFRVVMQDTERTLTDAEADAARDELVDLLGSRFSATLRT